MLVNRAKIILELDEADRRKPLTQAAIAEKTGVNRQAVNDAKRAFLAAENAAGAAEDNRSGGGAHHCAGLQPRAGRLRKMEPPVAG